jgi:hypothetical protein
MTEADSKLYESLIPEADHLPPHRDIEHKLPLYGEDTLIVAMHAAVIAERARATRGWQPIETAPKDGTWVLLCGGETTEDTFRTDLDASHTRRPVVGRWEQGWVYDFWDGDWRSGYDDPTHWQPLPEAPEVAT